MHDERVERHCAGIDDAIEGMKRDFIAMQNALNEMATQHKSDVLNMEVAFLSATKSLKLKQLFTF